MFGYEHDDAMRSNIRRYTVVEVNDKGTQQRVNLSGMKKEKPTKVWRPMPHGFTSNPPKGSDGYMIGMGGRSDRMLYADGGHEKYRPRDLPEGAMALYNHSGDVIRLFEDNCDLVHAKKINLKIGKGQDVSSDDGSKPPSGPDAHNISIVATGEDIVITFDDVSVAWRPGLLRASAPKLVVDCPDINLGGEGGIQLKRIDDSPAIRVKAL
jgi:phage gp45-like